MQKENRKKDKEERKQELYAGGRKKELVWITVEKLERQGDLGGKRRRMSGAVLRYPFLCVLLITGWVNKPPPI